MVLMDPNHPDHAAKASIREVYAIVSQLETKLVEELHRVEGRLTQAIEFRDEKHAEEIVSLRHDVDDLKKWRDEQETSSAVKAARSDGRIGPFRDTLYWFEDHWRLITVIAAIVITIILFVLDLDIGVHQTILP